MTAPTIILRPGQRGTYSGFAATVVRHYEGNMYEIRVPGGLTCVDAGDFIPAGLEWAELWAAMDSDPTRWFDTTEHMFDEMLNCLPPAAMGAGGFLVGEPTRHNENDEAIYACFVSRGGYQARYMTRREFKAWQLVRLGVSA